MTRFRRPPQSSAQGLSTVPTISEIFPSDDIRLGGPYGLGMSQFGQRESKGAVDPAISLPLN